MSRNNKHEGRLNADEILPYDGPIRRADGRKPYNRYLWPSWERWANQELGHRFSSRWHLDYVALEDGRYATEGALWYIESGVDGSGRRCVFDTRNEAIRAAASRLIRLGRAARKWRGIDSMSRSNLQDLVDWIRRIVTEETSVPLTPLRLYEPPVSPKPTGLPLFDSVILGGAQ